MYRTVFASLITLGGLVLVWAFVDIASTTNRLTCVNQEDWVGLACLMWSLMREIANFALGFGIMLWAYLIYRVL